MPILTFVTDKIEVKNADLEKGNLVFSILGIPYGGPKELDGKDWQGQWFDAKTYIGADLGVSEIYATLDHNISTDPKGRKVLSTERSMIGVATKTKVDDLGVWYDLEVKRGKQYQEMLLDLYGKGYLFGSSQPIQTTVEIEDGGYIKSWVPAEIALTTHAANPLAIVALVKNHGFETELKEIEAGDTSETVEAEVVVEVDGDGTAAKEDTLKDFVNDAFKDDSGKAETEETTPVEVVVSDDVLKRLEAIDTAVKALSSQVSMYVDFWGPLAGDDEQTATMRELLAQMIAASKSTNKGIANIEDGLKAFTEQVAKRLSLKVSEEASRLADMSEAERDAEIEVGNAAAVRGKRIFVNIPDNAPGG